ncbi:MAG: tryptophan 7-halogenase [Pseudomonadota bacterium]
MDKSPLNIVLCGSDFAVWLTALALRRQLPMEQAITVIETDAASQEGHLYGYILPPEIYPFHLKLGISEPDFLLNSTASFSWGTEFQNWGLEKRTWVQAFHHPLPVWDGVAFPKIIANTPKTILQNCLISVAAARAGRFAHPPEDPDNPLSRAEYD